MKGYKHTLETRKILSEKSKLSRRFSGKKHSEESKKKISNSMKKNGWVPPSQKGKCRPQSVRDKISKSHKGKRHLYQEGAKHWNWKGGLTSFLHLIRNCFQYRQWRSDIFHRDNFRCVLCGRKCGKGKKVYLEADHFPKRFIDIINRNNIKSFKKSLVCEELWDINNGRTLCRECHNTTRGNFKK